MIIGDQRWHAPSVISRYSCVAKQATEFRLIPTHLTENEEHGEPLVLDPACLCQLRSDVVIDSKEIRWIVFVLDGGQARKVVAEGTVNDLFGFDVERRQKMRVRGEGPKHFFTRAGPIPMDARLVRIGPLRHEQNVPRKISMWKS